MHTDTYGRSWRYAPRPGHDLNNALQIGRRTALFGVNTEFARCSLGTYTLRPGNEPYLLKTTDGWGLHVRLASGECDFHDFRGDIDPRIIAMMIEMHAKDIKTPAEAKAYDALVGETP